MAEKAKCRVCGAEFNPCKGVTGIPPEQQPLNWRKVCCSVPCGSQFINSILESRGLTKYGVPNEETVPEEIIPEEEDAVPGEPDAEDVAAESVVSEEVLEPTPRPRRQRKPAPQSAAEPVEPEVTAEPTAEE
jgi:hypothetical protein